MITTKRSANRLRNEAKYRAKHQEKIKARHKAWLESKPDYRKWEHLRRYGITKEFYEEMLEEQRGCCAICGVNSPGENRKLFCVDHNHRTGKVRGLLCARCNKGLGCFDDDAPRLERATAYLRGKL